MLRLDARAQAFALTWLAYAGFYFCRKNLSVMMPALSAGEGFSTDLLARVVFCYSVAYSLGQFTMGIVADRIGPRRVATAGMLVSALANLALAFTSGPEAFLILQTINGFAQACGWPALVKMISGWFAPRERGTALSWWCTNYVFGAFLATMFATFAISGPVLASWGWKRGAVFPALLLSVVAVIFARFAPGEGPLETPAVPSTSRWSQLREVVLDPAIQTIAVAYFFIKFTRYAFLFWLPLYMVQRLGYTQADAGYTSSAFELVGFTGVLAAGYLSDRVFESRRYPVGALMLAGLSVACLVHPTLSAQGWWGNLLGISLIGALVFGPDTLMGGAATQDLAARHAAASAAGFVNCVGSSGQLLSPLIVAFVVKYWGWDAVFYTFVVMAALGSFALATRWNWTRAKLPQEIEWQQA